MRMASYLGRRLAYFVVSVLGVLVITFVLTRTLPGNPVHLLAGPLTDQEKVDAATRELGLDRPLAAQFVTYVGDLVHGDLGTSLRTSQPVVDDLASRWPATAELAILAILVAVTWALVVGTLAAVFPRSVFARVADLVGSLGVSVPEFWLATVVILVFFTSLGIAPAPIGRISGTPPGTVTGFYTVDAVLTADWSALRASLAQLLLPVLTLALTTGAPMMRTAREFMTGVLGSPYIRAGRALGIPPARLVVRHALPNALLPVTTMVATMFGYLLGGTVMVEFVFAWPGVGKYAVDSITASDYAPVMAVVVLSAIVYLLVYLVTDLVHLVVDPRSRI